MDMTLATLKSITPDALQGMFSLPFYADNFFEDFWRCYNFDAYAGHSNNSVTKIQTHRIAEVRALHFIRDHQAVIEQITNADDLGPGAIMSAMALLFKANHVCNILPGAPFTDAFVQRMLPTAYENDLLWLLTEDQIGIDIRKEGLWKLLDANIESIKQVNGVLTDIAVSLFERSDYKQEMKLWLAMAWHYCIEGEMMHFQNISALKVFASYFPFPCSTPDEFVTFNCPEIAPVWLLVQDLDLSFSQAADLLLVQTKGLDQYPGLNLPDSLTL